MALINKLNAIGDAIRAKTGGTKKLTLDQMPAEIESIISEDETQTYILRDEEGNEVVGVLVDELTVFDATSNDIRIGKTAVTDSGITIGEKNIPSYHTTEGLSIAPVGSELEIVIQTANRYDFTKLQAIICPFNATVVNSVSAEKVAIENAVYAVGSTDALSTITIDHKNKAIKLGIINDGLVPCIIRYFTYKEEK